MRYEHTLTGIFLARPNRFIAHVLVNGKETVCHVKNTGRCRELLVPGACVVLSGSNNPTRKTLYDLVAVYKGTNLINIDSQAPNRVFREWAASGGFLPEVEQITPEVRYGHSRLDFQLLAGGKTCLAEIKGVTLEERGLARFPDAPTQRGARHLRELMEATVQGYICYAVFVIQMKGIHSFTPNDVTDREFGAALREAAKRGVKIIARDCLVTENTLQMGEPVPVLL